jgi:Fe-S oxidoreductase
LLFEMLHGGPIDNLWKSEAVEEALDLCLACKGCKSDCPVNTDMATYKAEFRSHHYCHRLRPRAAYSMGRIAQWSRIAGRMPWLANAMMAAPGLSTLLKKAGGISSCRTIPRYAPQTFVQWFHRRPKRKASGRRVMLWPDTFNNYFRPHTAIAAARVLEALGYDVVIPNRPVCCGRPLYDWGFLDKAKRLWNETLETLEPEIVLGTPIVGLEPACVSAFRDELGNLLSGNARAERLARQTMFISEFLARDCPDRMPRASGAALVHIHCHQHAVLNTDEERKVLDRMGLDYEVLKSGCCGMAGSFGFEDRKYDVSLAIGERVLLPRVRQAPPDTAIMANGFSCREQIEQTTGRPTLHIAQMLWRALSVS